MPTHQRGQKGNPAGLGFPCLVLVFCANENVHLLLLAHHTGNYLLYLMDCRVLHYPAIYIQAGRPCFFQLLFFQNQSRQMATNLLWEVTILFCESMHCK